MPPDPPLEAAVVAVVAPAAVVAGVDDGLELPHAVATSPATATTDATLVNRLTCDLLATAPHSAARPNIATASGARRDERAYHEAVTEPRPTLEQIRRVPKVLLHDHLDGGLRAQTVIELADEIGYRDLPTDDPVLLAQWFTDGADRQDLPKYLDGFRHTVAVMQSADALARVARECAEDLADDGVAYAEIRYAPELHQSGGLGLDEVVEAVTAGFAEGSAGRPITVYSLLTAMRTAAQSLSIAEVAVRHRDSGVVGFDIAGAEAGSPPTRHLDAFDFVRHSNFHITIHAGEGFGLPSIWEALQWCGAERLGHGVRLIDDISLDDAGHATLGPLASYVRDRRIPLEMCPTSNVHTGAAASLHTHPIGLLRRLGFRVTVNTDNRLMSGVTVSGELQQMVEQFDYGWDDLQWLTINAMKSAFAHFDERLALINGRIKPGFAAVRAEAALPA